MEVGTRLDYEIGEVNPRTLRNLASRAARKRGWRLTVVVDESGACEVHRLA